MSYQAAKDKIDLYIKTNGVGAITGPVLNDVLTILMQEIPAGEQGEKGEKGDTGAGTEGKRGPDGLDGIQAWLNLNPGKTYADYLIAMKGPKGDPGADAIQSWLDRNPGKTFTDYMAAIRGIQGEQGIAGPPGPSDNTRPSFTASNTAPVNTIGTDNDSWLHIVSPTIAKLYKRESALWTLKYEFGGGAFNGNRTIKSLPQIGQNYGTDTTEEWLDAAFFAFLPAYLFFNGHGLKAVGDTANITLFGGYVARDETFFNDRILFKDGSEFATGEWVDDTFDVDDTITATTAYRAEVTVGDPDVSYSTIGLDMTVTFVFPYYYIAGPEFLTPDDIKAGNRLVTGVANHTANYTVANGRMYYAVPQRNGHITSIIDNTNAEVIGSFVELEEVFSFPGYPDEPYYVYMNDADFTGTDFPLLFKH